MLGQFRDRDDPDRFVWLRGFPDMAARQVALESFYDGLVWGAHGPAANATMVDSDDVMLLRPLRRDSGIRPSLDGRPPPGATGDGPGMVVATVLLLDDDQTSQAPFGEGVLSALGAAGVDVLGAYETESAPNTFPRLPVRESDNAFVWFAAYEDEHAHARADVALAAHPTWDREVQRLLRSPLVREITTLRLVPTARSRMVGTVWTARSSKREL